MSLTPSKYDPCLFSGIINDGTPPSTPPQKIHVGLYVDYCVFLFKSDAEKSCFKRLPNDKFTTDADLVHVFHQACTEDTASRFGLKDCNWVPHMTPYSSGCHIDSIPDPEPEDPDLPKRKATYQSICGSMNWLAISTCPGFTTVLSFLAA